MAISDYSTSDSNNNGGVPDGAPAGMLPSDVIDVFRRIMSNDRNQWNSGEWFEYRDGTPSGTASYVAGTQFKITGADATAHYHIGRRVKVTDNTGDVYANITAVSYGSGATTVTIDQSLASPVTKVCTSVLSATNDAIPREVIQDIVGTMLTGNTETNITVTYQDSDGTIDFTVTDLAWGNITGKPATFTPSAHTHTEGDLPNASTSGQGVVQLYDGSDSVSTTLAPTAAALKAVADAVAGAGSGDLLSTNNLSDVANPATARTNLGLAIGTNVQAYSAVLANTTASFTTADETKLDGIATNANNYTHPTTAGNKHIPTGGSTYDALVYSASGTAQWSTTAYNAHGQRTISTSQPSGGSDGDIWYVYE